MNLQGLYTIAELTTESDTFSAGISFDAGHDIFNGHFPGQPVVPGVCLIHIVKEIANMISREKLQLKKGSNIKFLQLIDPGKNPEVIIKGKCSKSESGELSVSASITNTESTFFKFKGQFV